MKISIIGAGNVGSALAERVLAHNLGDVILVDAAEGLARGKALDISDAAPIMGYGSAVKGTDRYEDTEGSDIVVLAAGMPRRPGMTRGDLRAKNAEIVEAVAKNIKKFSPESVLIVVTNPLDAMTYLAYKATGFDRHRVFGMAGNLDGARLKALLSQETGVGADKIETFVLGSHGDTMVPLVSRTRIGGRPLGDVLEGERIQKVLLRARKRGGEIVSLLRSGSAYFSPSAACLEILKAIVGDEKKIIVCSSVVNGEYGITGCAIGVPVRIGRNGIEEIFEWELSPGELESLKKSAKAVREQIERE